MSPHYVLDARTATPHFPGIGRYVTALARALPPLLAPDERVTLLYDAAHSAALPPPGTGLAMLPVAATPFSARQQWSMPGALRQVQADLYHSPYYLMPYFPGVPALLTVYDLIPLVLPGQSSARARLLFRWTCGRALRTARHVIAISQVTRHDYLTHFHISPDGIEVIPLAADPIFHPQPPDAMTAVRDRYGLPERFVLYIGSNKPHKNLMSLVEAWRMVRGRDHGARPQLAIAGPWDDRYAAPQQRAEALGLRDAIRWLGPAPDADLPALYAAATLFVFPSLYEGFGLPVLEAMACATPVVCSDRSSLPEVAGDAALLIDPHDRVRLAATIEQVLGDDGLRQGMRERGLKRAGQFTWEQTAKRTLDVYRRHASNETRPTPSPQAGK
jgi:alpha-1,3-rhamnosyl/mannosyltransferase